MAIRVINRVYVPLPLPRMQRLFGRAKAPVLQSPPSSSSSRSNSGQDEVLIPHSKKKSNQSDSSRPVPPSGHSDPPNSAQATGKLDPPKQAWPSAQNQSRHPELWWPVPLFLAGPKPNWTSDRLADWK